MTLKSFLSGATNKIAPKPKRDMSFDGSQRFERRWKGVGVDASATESNDREEEEEEEVVPTLHDPQYRNLKHEFVYLLTEGGVFAGFIMVVILINTLTVAIQANNQNSQEVELLVFFQVVDLVFLVIYFFEFVLKLYAQPRGYWSSSYNRFDFIILAFSMVDVIQTVFFPSAKINTTFLRVLRALRAMRALRSVSMVRSLQVIVSALLKTMASIVHLVTLLLLIMYVFAIMGFYVYGGAADGDPENWGDLGTALMTLWVFVTADGWVDVLNAARDKNMDASLFCVSFIFIGHFVCTNLFIGVIVQNLEEATEEERLMREKEKKKLFAVRKQMILAKQEEDLLRLLSNRHVGEECTMQDLIGRLAGKLRHDDLVALTSLCTNLVWLETFISTLYLHENAMYRCQQLHFEIASTLGNLAEHSLLQSLESNPQVEHWD